MNELRGCVFVEVIERQNVCLITLQLKIPHHIWKHFLLVDMDFEICNQLVPFSRQVDALLRINKAKDDQPIVITYYCNFYLIDVLLKWRVMRGDQ